MRPRTALLIVVLALLCGSITLFSSWEIVRQGARHVMHSLSRHHLALPYAPPPAPEQWQPMTADARLADVRSRLLPKLPAELAELQLQLGQPAFIRIFKESREFELWLKSTDKAWKLFRNYSIAGFSGSLGPKTKEGDLQAPEGFYAVTQRQLNPASSYHLSFNIGYPNAYDHAHQRTGSLIMVHGDTVSIGCFAMTDPLIEEIYLIVEAALKTNVTVPIHIFPFRITEERLQKEQDSPHIDFWKNLRPAHDLFEKERRVSQITVVNGRYQAR